MCGSTRSTTSPSSSSTKRSTPWAAGCCGPKLMVKLRRLCSAMVLTGLRGLLVAGKDIIRPLPRREEIEIAELLGEAHRVVDDALDLVVPAHLDESGEREVLAQRIALEAIVGEDATHVRVADEQHAVEVVRLALEPVGAGIDGDDRGHRRRLVGLDLDPHAPIQLG